MSSQIQSQIQKQMSVLGSQAAQVFGREAFKLAVWVGVFGSFSRGKQAETSDIDIVIFYNPDYSEKQVRNRILAARKTANYSETQVRQWYSRCEKRPWGTDPDEPKLERVWGRKIDT